MVEASEEQASLGIVPQDVGEGEDDVVGIQVRERGWVYRDVETEVGDKVEESGCLEAGTRFTQHEEEDGSRSRRG